MRLDNRANDELRAVKITRKYISHPEGSVLVEFGDTRLICNATVDPQVPRWLKGKNRGWISAEYGMLPRSTNERMRREKSARGGRSMEIQRLIGRSLRAAVDLEQLGERQIIVDCDVIQADGGTRTAAITGGFVALADALSTIDIKPPVLDKIASVSVGIVDNTPMLDLCYLEDCNAQTDMNVVMNDKMEYIEIQGTAEKTSFSHDELDKMLKLARGGISRLFAIQQETLGW